MWSTIAVQTGAGSGAGSGAGVGGRGRSGVEVAGDRSGWDAGSGAEALGEGSIGSLHVEEEEV